MAGTVEGVTPEQLAGVELLAGLSTEELEQVAERATRLHVPLGEVVAEEGDLPTKFFMLLEGSVTVHRGGHHAADLRAGDVFGEAGVVALQPRNASVIATTPVEAVVVMGWDLRELLERIPDLKTRLEALAADRH